MEGCRLESTGSGQEEVVETCEDGNEVLRYIKCWKLLE
jgi:hypothetical protein